MKSRLVVVVQQTEVHRIAFSEDVAPIKVGGIYALIAHPPAVQAAIGILLKHVEVCQVVLKNVVVKCAEQAHAWLLIGKSETGKLRPLIKPHTASANKTM